MPKLIAGKPEEVKPVEHPTHVWCEPYGDSIKVKASNPATGVGDKPWNLMIIKPTGVELSLCVPEELGIALDDEGRVVILGE